MEFALEREWDVAIAAAQAAGEVVRFYYRRKVTVRYKEAGKHNPVSEADLEANRVIESHVRASFPDDGWLSEETRDSSERLHKRRVWIVDPLDGSREFLEHIPEFVVCVALAIDGQPVLGVEYNPIREELFAGAVGQGAFLGGERVYVSSTATLAEARFLASRSEDRRGEWDEFKNEVRVELTGSVAYKLALIAAGKADATFSLTPKNEWDICAGAALIAAAGGRMTNRFGAPLRFNQKQTRLPGIIATNGVLHEAVLDLLARHGKLAAHSHE
ncbi:MAG: 3'(2'),5'-bisphosphate nucleotidase CysQ [Candidatus Binatia bacterium]|nr:3'(2'),5'-bisphosphate nucleotidase CysQ [Candidatus Binatia bacterium]